ncbi:MAG TPA: sigma-70 family RNA polymerase sigma factor [Verrucomicrobiae bacterium]|nr:sigma-70 family RNA polymerase sigma factor [Verrucomicrobiae bacterium]
MIKINSDLLLILRSQRGDQAAFSSLFDRYQQRVFRTSLHLVRDKAMAEDITQEVFITVFQKIKELRSPSAFRTWLYRIAVNRATQLLRSKDSPHHSLPLEYAGEVSDSSADPLTETLNRSELAALRREICSLPDELRLPILLHYYSGLRITEIASVLGIPSGTVKSRMRTAKAKLAAALEPNTANFKGVIREANL